VLDVVDTDSQQDVELCETSVIDSDVSNSLRLPRNPQSTRRGVPRNYQLLGIIAVCMHGIFTINLLIAYWVREAGWNIAVTDEHCTRISLILTLYFFVTIVTILHSYYLYLDVRLKHRTIGQSLLCFKIDFVMFLALGFWTVGDSLSLNKECRDFVRNEGSQYLLSSYELYGWWHLFVVVCVILIFCFRPTLCLHKLVLE